METSTRQLKNRYSPIAPLTHTGNHWTFASESKPNTIYTTTRQGKTYSCTCPAKGLCKHITRAILDDARQKFGIVQVWTSEADARRQKRRRFAVRANGAYAWVTVGAEVDSVAKLDAEIVQVTEAIAQARHLKLMTNDANRRRVQQIVMDANYQRLPALQRERERLVARRNR